MATVLASPGWNLGKEVWPQNSIYDLVLDGSPLIGKLRKNTKFGEDKMHIAMGSGLPQGVGPVFELAKGGKTASVADQMTLTAKTLYALFSIQGRLMRQAKIDKAVIVKPYGRESRNAIQQWKRDYTAFLYGNGGGAIGKVSAGSTVTTATITLSDTSKIRNFAKNQILWASTADGTSGTVKSGEVTVLSVKYYGANKGQITVKEASWDTGIPTIATGDFLFRRGVFGNVITGLDGYLPKFDPGTGGVPSTLNALDRSGSPTEYAGIRIDGTNLTVLNAGIQAASAIVDFGGMPDLWVMSTTEWNTLRIELSAAGSLTYGTSPATGIGKYKPGMSYKSMTIIGPRGDIEVLADPDCPVGRSYMLMTECWEIASTGELVSLIESPMMEELADAWESRFVGDSEVVCEAPGYNATIQHTAGA